MTDDKTKVKEQAKERNAAMERVGRDLAHGTPSRKEDVTLLLDTAQEYRRHLCPGMEKERAALAAALKIPEPSVSEIIHAAIVLVGHKDPEVDSAGKVLVRNLAMNGVEIESLEAKIQSLVSGKSDWFMDRARTLETAMEAAAKAFEAKADWWKDNVDPKAATNRAAWSEAAHYVRTVLDTWRTGGKA